MIFFVDFAFLTGIQLSVSPIKFLPYRNDNLFINNSIDSIKYFCIRIPTFEEKNKLLIYLQNLVCLSHQAHFFVATHTTTGTIYWTVKRCYLSKFKQAQNANTQIVARTEARTRSIFNSS